MSGDNSLGRELCSDKFKGVSAANNLGSQDGSF